MIAEAVDVGEVTAAMGEQSLGLGEDVDDPTTVLVGVPGAAAAAEFAIGVTVIKLRCVARRVAILLGFILTFEEFGKLYFIL